MKLANAASGGLIAMALALLAPVALAQEGQGDVVYVPTPQVVVDEMLRMAKVGSSDYLIDLGSGDGRIIITASKRLGAQGFGVDLDTYLLKLANQNAKKEGVADRAQFFERNLFETDLSKATVITSYLLPEMNEKLRPKLLALRPGTRVVTHDYSMGDWDADEEKTLLVPEKTVGDPGKSYIFLYIVPAHVAGEWESTVTVGGKPVSYHFDLEQRFQLVKGTVTVGGREAKVPQFRLVGDRIAFSVSAPAGAGMAPHRFSGTVKGEAIEGTVTIGSGSGERTAPWRAKLTQRGQMQMSASGAAAVASAAR
jgi:16S rRNA G966 N2-methylase RsmD